MRPSDRALKIALVNERSMLRTFGGLAIVAGSGHSPGASAIQRRRLALLAVLAASGPTGMSREKLMSLFWPESDESSARRALNQALYALRSGFAADDLFTGSTTLALNCQRLESDVAQFLDALARGEHARAAELYRGPFLDGVHLSAAPGFERWVDSEREALQRRYLDALSHLASAAQASGATADAVQWARRRVEATPFDSAAVVALMRALAAMGDIPAALQQARVYATRVEMELGFPPDAQVRALAIELREGAAPPEPPRVGRPRTPPRAHAAPVVVTHLQPPPQDASALEPQRRWHPRRLGIIAVGLGATLLIAALTLFRGRDDGSAERVLDDRLVAIAPFTVVDSGLALWREGMVDLLAQSLDGAGPVRAVPPMVSLRSTPNGEATDPQELARATGARVVLTGSVLRAGDGAIRVAVSLLDTRTTRPLGSIERRGTLDRMDLLVDSLTVDILRELDRWIPLGAARSTGVRPPRSIEALRAFLRGEQHFRRLRWDSAAVFYSHAIEHDTTFTLAAWRLGTVLSWQRLATDTMAETWLLRAGAMNRGLPPRDSLLVAADSLAAASNALPTFAASWPYTRRLIAMLEGAARRYPDDPEVWHAVGEARYHFAAGPLIGVPDSATLGAFDRAIALDSAFAPAYVHTPELALTVHGREAALRYLRAYLSLGARPAEHGGLQLMARLLQARSAREELESVQDTLSADAIFPARTAMRRWPDSGEVALQLTRLLKTPGRRSSYAGYVDTAMTQRLLAEQMAFRGHLRAAATEIEDRDAAIYPEVAYLGGITSAAADAGLRRRVLAGSRWVNPALSYWSERRDTSALAVFRDSARVRLARATSLAPRSMGTYDTAAVQAHLALARGDSATALALFVALPDTLCPRCFTDRLTRGRLLLARGRTREALATFSEPLVALQSPMEVLFAFHRGRTAAQLRERRVAELAFGFVADAWRHADAELRPYVDEARRSRGSR